MHPIGRRDIALPRHPERHRINERFTQDKRPGRTQCGFIPDALMCARQVQMTDNRRPQIITDHAPGRYR
uniref:hypothetical protein n=1 Tax=Xenorhabdus sp. GDc328 TaxID=742178 RepID=UPI0030D6F744